MNKNLRTSNSAIKYQHMDESATTNAALLFWGVFFWGGERFTRENTTSYFLFCVCFFNPCSALLCCIHFIFLGGNQMRFSLWNFLLIFFLRGVGGSVLVCWFVSFVFFTRSYSRCIGKKMRPPPSF